jgi:hypothetical protein
MSNSWLFSLLADSILIIHFSFVIFVVLGFLLILLGLLAKWSWVHNRKFRITHLAAIGVVVLQAWLGQLCPLTLWENELRRMSGQPGYDETFVEHWLHEILFYEAEPWIFTTIYTCFGALVVLVWFLGKRGGREEER